MKRRENSSAGGRSEDKRLRLEAGLDLDVNQDLSDLQVDQILKEVRPPSSVQNLVDEFSEKVRAAVTCTLPKLGLDQLEAEVSPHKLPVAVGDGYKFPGAKLECKAGEGLATSTMLFPNAVANFKVFCQFSKMPGDKEKLRRHCSAAAALSASKLNSIKNFADTVRFTTNSLEGWPAVKVVPKGKLSKYLTAHICFVVAGLPTSWADNQEGELVEKMKRESLLSEGLEQEIFRLLSGHSSYRDSVIVLKIWSKHMRLSRSGYLLEMLLLHCHLTNQVTPRMKVWQIVKRLWTFMTESDLLASRVILGVSSLVPRTGADDSSVSVLDRGGSAGVTEPLPCLTWKVMSRYAGAAVLCPADTVLLAQQTTAGLFDRVYRFKGVFEPGRLVDNLSTGLGSRVESLVVLNDRVEWPTVEQAPGHMEVCLGLQLAGEQYGQAATHGPEADHPDAAKFRQFWGERSELRRFKDGSVKEVVVWTDDKEKVVCAIVTAVVGRHHPGVEVREEPLWGHQVLSGDGGVTARAAYDKLVSLLYNLPGLPLSVASVGVHSCEGRLARVGEAYAGGKVGGKSVKEKDGHAVLTGKSGMAPYLVRPVEMAVSLEKSGKWPKDEEAVRRVKVAWLLEVAKGLRSAGCLAGLRGERLLVRLDDTFLRLAVTDRSDSSLELAGCQLTSWLHGLAKRHLAYSGSVRLAKRWVSSHLLALQVPDTAVEICMAHVFQHPAHLHAAPASPEAGLVRWLQLVSSHNWNDLPLCVDTQAENLVQAMSLNRRSLPAMVLATPHDSDSRWTAAGAPSWPALQRLVTLASRTVQLVQEGADLPRRIFTPSLDDFDCLIHLKPLQVATRHLSLGSILQSTRLESQPPDKLFPIVDYNPAQLYLAELAASFGQLADFFYDIYGGTVIAVKFKTGCQEERPRIGGLLCKQPDGGQATVSVNWGAVIEDFSILGEGLVKTVHCSNIDQLLVQ